MAPGEWGPELAAGMVTGDEPAPWWDDLSGAELRSRLTNRGMAPEAAARLVNGRDRWLSVRALITRTLGAAP